MQRQNVQRYWLCLSLEQLIEGIGCSTHYSITRVAQLLSGEKSIYASRETGALALPVPSVGCNGWSVNVQLQVKFMVTSFGRARTSAVSEAFTTATGTGQAKWQPACSAFKKIWFLVSGTKMS